MALPKLNNDIFLFRSGRAIHSLVRLKGLEPTRIAAREPKSRMSTNTITGAYSVFEITDTGNGAANPSLR